MNKMERELRRINNPDDCIKTTNEKGCMEITNKKK